LGHLTGNEMIQIPKPSQRQRNTARGELLEVVGVLISIGLVALLILHPMIVILTLLGIIVAWLVYVLWQAFWIMR
jgi:hypothetical protein